MCSVMSSSTNAHTHLDIVQLKRACCHESISTPQNLPPLCSLIALFFRTSPVGKELWASLQAKIQIFYGTLTFQNIFHLLIVPSTSEPILSTPSTNKHSIRRFNREYATSFIVPPKNHFADNKTAKHRCWVGPCRGAIIQQAESEHNSVGPGSKLTVQPDIYPRGSGPAGPRTRPACWDW